MRPQFGWEERTFDSRWREPNPPLRFDREDVEDARKWNKRLAWVPTFEIRSRLEATFLQTMLLVQQLGPRFYDKRYGVTIETRHVEHEGQSVELRIIHPPGRSRGVYLDIHGGAWILGNARVNDPINVQIAAECGMTVVSVEYRLALDHPIEACIHDCETAALWLAAAGCREFGANTIVIGGESAGAHLAAATLLRLRDSRWALPRFAGAVLFYGVYDMCGSNSMRCAGPDTLLVHGPTLHTNLLRLTEGRTDEERRCPRLSPLYADLTGLPPALMLVGDRDPLIDDTLLFAQAWDEHNGNAGLVVAPEAPHAFNRFGTRMAQKTNAHVRDWIVDRLSQRRLRLVTGRRAAG
jgi:acetyl esterase/lipase